MFSAAGFETKGTVKALTKGIWILVTEHPTKTDCKLVLLDSEGLNDPETVDNGSI